MKCQVKMIQESNYSLVLMSPWIAITRMQTLSERCGIDLARTDGKFKHEREAFAAGVLALALSKLKEYVFWIEVEMVDSTPDTRLWLIHETEKGNVFDKRNVESVDWDENVDDIMEVIRKKCKKAYPRDYVLLVHARNYEKEINFGCVIEEMKGIQSPFLEIWVFAVLWQFGIFKVVRVSPALPVVELKIPETLEEASKQHPFLMRGRRGSTPGFWDAGDCFLPLPRCD